MSGASCDPETFYCTRVPAQFNRTLEAQAQAAANGDETAQKTLTEMKTVNACIGVRIQHSDGRDQSYNLNIGGGRMSAGEEPLRTPFMTLIHDLDSFVVLERESGDSILGFLGAVAGMQEEMKLTSKRIQNLNGLNGSLRFDLTGDNAFSIVALFGSEPVPAEPTCSVTIDEKSYNELRAGTLAPQDAFMAGSVQVAGDMQMVMQIALAAVSPE